MARSTVGPAENSLDWPLSRDEKRGCVLRLYDKDLQSANHLLETGHAALETLRRELHQIRVAGPSMPAPDSANAHAAESSNLLTDNSGNDQDVQLEITSRSPHIAGDDVSAAELRLRRKVLDSPASSNEHEDFNEGLCEYSGETPDEKSERLRQAIASATSALGALLESAALAQEPSVEEGYGRMRARSEGARHEVERAPGVLYRGQQRRRSRSGDPFRVSFASDVVQKFANEISNSDNSPHYNRDPSPAPSYTGEEPEPETATSDNAKDQGSWSSTLMDIASVVSSWESSQWGSTPRAHRGTSRQSALTNAPRGRSCHSSTLETSAEKSSHKPKGGGTGLQHSTSNKELRRSTTDEMPTRWRESSHTPARRSITISSLPHPKPIQDLSSRRAPPVPEGVNDFF